MGILDQSNNCSCSCSTSTASETKDSGYCCNITPSSVESCSSVGVGSTSSSSCSCSTTCSTPTKDSGYCCNIPPQASRLGRRRGRRR